MFLWESKAYHSAFLKRKERKYHAKNSKKLYLFEILDKFC
jgi:hypothetical protein